MAKLKCFAGCIVLVRYFD